jgi:hypothetical protein
MKKEIDLIYDLIFSDKLVYDIDLSNYVEDIYRYDDFVEHIKFILKKSKVIIIKSSVKVDSKTARWELKVKK